MTEALAENLFRAGRHVWLGSPTAPKNAGGHDRSRPR